MLCRDFEIIACDLAEEFLSEAGLSEAGLSDAGLQEAGLQEAVLLDARTRERGLRHAAKCPNCAARLTAERALTQGLQALSKSDEDLKAPAHLKVALRAAFDRQAELSSAPPPIATPVWPVWKNRW